MTGHSSFGGSSHLVTYGQLNMQQFSCTGNSRKADSKMDKIIYFTTSSDGWPPASFLLAPAECLVYKSIVLLVNIVRMKIKFYRSMLLFVFGYHAFI
jgi:hypothetical protein